MEQSESVTSCTEASGGFTRDELIISNPSSITSPPRSLPVNTISPVLRSGGCIP